MVTKEQHIPDGWCVKKIIDTCPLQRGFDLPEQKVVIGSYPIVYSNGIKGTHCQFKAKAPGVVTGRSGTIGKVTYVEKDYWPHNTSLWVTDFKGNNPKFIFYKLTNLNFAKFNSGSGVPTLNRNDVHIEKILIPPLLEQEKIAEILGVWDDGIEKLSNLIEEKKKLKKGLMQKILTGKQRLKGFSEPWKEVKLGTLGNCIRGVSYKPEDLYEKDGTNTVRLLRSTNIQNQSIDIAELQFINISKANNKQLLQNDDTIICMANGSKRLVGKAAKYIKSDSYLYTVGAFCGIYRSNNKIPNKLIYYYFQTHKYQSWVQLITAGSNINNLKNEDINNFNIIIPTSLPEQQVIADILSKQDEEIELLNKKLDVLKEQKKGLMQQLLTGKVRVKVN